jgi:hypothetical protein
MEPAIALRSKPEARPDVSRCFNASRCISPYRELIAYEYLWAKQKVSLKSIAALPDQKNELPSTIVDEEHNTFFRAIENRATEVKVFVDKMIDPPVFLSCSVKKIITISLRTLELIRQMEAQVI